MSFTVSDFEDLLKIIEAKPEWRSRLRRALFPEIDIPKAYQTLAESQAEMSSILKRLDTRVERLEIGQEQIKQDVGVLKQDVGVLKQDVGILKQDVGILKQDVGVLKRDVGVLKRDSANLKGKAQEQTYHNKADAIFGRYLRNGRKAGSWVADHLYAALLDEKVSEAEVEQVLAADLLWIGEERQTKTQLVLVMEASWLAEANDVERALKRAAVLERIGLHALPVVGGEEWTQDATTLARTHHVVVTMNGYIDKDSWQAAWSKRTQ